MAYARPAQSAVPLAEMIQFVTHASIDTISMIITASSAPVTARSVLTGLPAPSVTQAS
jgi:hypothetical protein